MRTLLPLAALLALALLPSCAHAGSAQVTGGVIPPECSKCGGGDNTTTIEFNAAPGEANDVVVTEQRSGGADVITFRDASGPVVVTQQAVGGIGCVAQPDGSAVCTAMSGRLPTVALGDGDDRASIGAGLVTIALHIEGAAGNDVITGTTSGDTLGGGPGNDTIDGLAGTDKITDFTGQNTLRGGDDFDTISGGSDGDDIDAGPGNDVVNGHGGADTLRGGVGNDDLADGDKTGSTDPDTVDGGAGRDLLRYTTRTAPVTVDLAAGTGGEAGEGDKLAAFEDVLGGSKDDRLSGDDGANKLDGRGGRNTLAGRGGDDLLNAHEDNVTCGAGADLVVRPNPKQVLGRDCERLDLWEDGRSIPRPVLRGSSLVFSIPCASIDGDTQSCLTRVKVGPRTPWGTATARKPIKFKQVATMSVGLTPTGLKAVKGGKTISVTIVQTLNGNPGSTDTKRYLIAG